MLECELRGGAKADPDVARFFSSDVKEILLPFESGQFYYDIPWLRWNDLILHLDFEFKECVGWVK